MLFCLLDTGVVKGGVLCGEGEEREGGRKKWRKSELGNGGRKVI